MTLKKNLTQSGFTLIEIIVTVVVVAIMGTMMITFLSKSLVDSGEPVKRLRQLADLNKVVTNITADYYQYPKWRSGIAYAGGNFVVPTIRNGHFYLSGGGTSGSVEPDNWPTTTAATVNDGGVTWTESGSLTSPTTLKGRIGPENSDQNNAYGTYHVESNRFILFASDSETDDSTGSNKILKVTIKNVQGEILTALFISN